MRGIATTAAVCVLGLSAPATAHAAGPEGPPMRPDTHPVMFVGNNWEGTADIVDARTYRRLARINTIPDREERMAEILMDPVRTAFFLGIRQVVGEGNDQFTDDMFTSHDGRFVYVSRPSFADVVGIDLRTGAIVWRFEMEGQRSDHMAISPDGTSLLVSDSLANKVHRLDPRTGAKTAEFDSGDSPHENNYTRDGSRVFHASIGRVYTPIDRDEIDPVRDATKGERVFQIVDARTMAILAKWDMGERLEAAGHEGMDSAVRPMALDPHEQKVYAQISFHHGFVEFDVASGTVTRVASLPVSEEAQAMQREEYLLDSAHHGLAMNEEGTKLCVAGTMSDYAAIVQRDTFAHKLFEDIGKKPYWATNGLDGTCWLSVSGDDRVVVLDYRTEREIARVPVGDHPQRVRLGAINKEYVPGLIAQGGPPAPSGGPGASGPAATTGSATTPRTRPRARDARRPVVRIAGIPRRCRRSAFRARIRIRDRSSLRATEVRLGRRLLRRTRRKAFSVRVPVRGLRPGTHRLRIRATDAAGNRTTRTARFRRCASR